MTHVSGFDYGTSNCAIGVMQEGRAQLQLLEQGKAFIPSTLYALHRDLIPEWIASNWACDSQQLAPYKQSRQHTLDQASRFRREEGISNDEQSLFFGLAAFDEYLAMPDEGYFVKSPKSFLGSSGLQASAIDFFEDIVSAMMMHIKQQAEHNIQDTISHTVIGRPVNFQGINSEESNRQAQTILSNAAMRSGFKHCEFLYEPLAAGIHFEDSLDQNNTVLVVDIGGGTTDCSMVRMGPDHKNKTNRQDDFLGHSGERIGGNDLDIAIAAYEFMPLFGMQSFKKNKLPMPTQLYWNAVSTNNLAAQAAFYNQETHALIEQLQRDAAEPKLISRLIKMRKARQNHQIVRSAEQCKINLSE
ncbi:MAG: molecular chaperone, partial [Sinobacterium sp.]|nr:molecular chaperone [Sinobacterium sp.]